MDYLPVGTNNVCGDSAFPCCGSCALHADDIKEVKVLYFPSFNQTCSYEANGTSTSGLRRLKLREDGAISVHTTIYEGTTIEMYCNFVHQHFVC